ncbi:MAG TPA: ParB/RepB/Spo0J family partition protein, partial [Candidatus Omnitrophota bacterium]|nr:ParB/RepB/Spo0J family partition protein [Candidatus Omnitrophota bacterium]
MTDQTPFDRIVALVEARGISGRAASTGAGLDPSALANAKRQGGKLDLSTITKFANFLGVPLSQLLGEAPPPAAVAGEPTAPHNRIRPSPRNPRKRFDQVAIDELAASVAAKGILQPILVRRANQPGNRPLDGATPDDFEIIAGERRWRAAARCIELGLQPADWDIPIKLRDCSDREMLEIALTENIQRNDMTPLEEGDAFAQLIDEGATTEDIAKVQGKTMRYVQQRLALVQKLTATAKQKLADGEITFSQARVLTTLPPDRQSDLLPDIDTDMTADDVRDMALRGLFPVASAIFDLAEYGGVIIEDEEGGRYLADGAEFLRLQQAAIQNKRKEYQAAGTPWVKVTGRDQPGRY